MTNHVMKYQSTRDQNAQAPVSFSDMVFTGLAPDGGLYMPEIWPELSPQRLAMLQGQRYAQVAGVVLAPFCVGPDLSEEDLATIVNDVYGPRAGIFNDLAIAPLRPLGPEMHLMELFHGPTLAFKDVALQVLGRVFDHLLAKRNQTLTIIGATSGDTGSAAIHACKGIKRAKIFIFHPAGKVSEIQRRQMTTVVANNVYNIALDGSFDDCQAMVKTLFADRALNDQLNFTTVNSINWLRIAAQSVYYVTASLALGGPDREVSFAVPTGNFGNIFAAFAARAMGVPIRDLIIASNRNDILPRFFATGEMAVDKVRPSLSPSMDIQVSSNFERYLFELLHRDARAVDLLMNAFKDKGAFRLSAPDFARAGKTFSAFRVDDDRTLATIKDVYKTHDIILDPHTAVGVCAARDHLKKNPDTGPVVALACAHPAKFPEAIKRAIGKTVPLPDHLSDLMTRIERVTPMRNDIKIVTNYIKGLAT